MNPNATAPSPALKLQCLRRGIPMPLDAVTAARLIPVVQHDIARHMQHQARHSTLHSGDYIEWKHLLEDLQQFLADLEKLASPPPPAKSPSTEPLNPTDSLRGNPANNSPATHHATPAPTTKEEHAAWIAAAKARCASRTQQKPAEKNSHPASESTVEPEPVPCETDPRNTRATPETDPRNSRSAPEPDPSHQPNNGHPRLTERQRAFLAQLLRERTAKSPLDHLSAERQQTLYEMLEDLSASIVNDMISLPEPDGWGVVIHRSSLARFHNRYRKKLEAAERAEALAEADKIEKELGPDSPQFAQVTQRLLKLRSFRSALNPRSATRDLEALFRIIDRHRRTDLAERKQTLAEQSTSNPSP